MSQDRALKAVDLFCGCGGISVGLQMAGYQILAGIDIEKKYIASFQHNFPNAKALTMDITRITPLELMNSIGIIEGELDILVGGPPCQGFSKNVPRKNRCLEDPKNQLVKSFLDYCEILKPKMVLMENVAEMKNGFDETYSQEIICRLEKEGYTITSGVLNSADYGVPQKRKRAFFIANRLGLKFRLPTATHFERKNNVTSINLSEYITVWEAISDLPSLEHGDGADIATYRYKPKTKYQKLMRRDNVQVKNHIARKLSDIQYQRLASIQPGQGHKDLPIHLQTKGGYSGAYGRLTKNMVAPTITRWVFHPGSGRWGHPKDIRTITIRETARIQSFPDNFEFIGSYTDQAGQLGNAVPPLLAYSIINSMKNQILEFKKTVNSSHETLSSSEGNLKATA